MGSSITPSLLNQFNRKHIMKIISIFNNKGGVGKTTLTFHLAHILAEMGKKTLLIDMDSQSNLSLFSIPEDKLGRIWQEEDSVIDNGIKSEDDFKKLLEKPRTIHYLLKPTEDGVSDSSQLSPPISLADNLDLVPSRLTLFSYENKIAERWSGMFLGEQLSIRTVTRIRKIAEQYAAERGYEFVIIDTSPSLGIINKVVISTVDGFIIPCLPDLFSLYGIKNIGKALAKWYSEFNICYSLLSEEKKREFPKNFVRFLGYVIYNAKKRSDSKNELKIAQAHHNYAEQIPEYIRDNLKEEVTKHLSDKLIQEPIGSNSIIHSHNTLPSMAQKYHLPMWKVPACYELESDDKSTISGNRDTYTDTRAKYEKFALSFLERIETLDD